jgi:hypothetical protein
MTVLLQVFAQVLVFIAYMLYGCFVYVRIRIHLMGGITQQHFQGYQGQFTLPLAYQGVSKYAWQTVGKSTVF